MNIKQAQEAFVKALRRKGTPHFSLAVDWFKASIKEKRSNELLGIKPGVPKVLFFANSRTYAVFFISNSTTPHQKKWIQTLNDNGVETIVARGAGEAIDFIDKKIKEV